VTLNHAAATAKHPSTLDLIDVVSLMIHLFLCVLKFFRWVKTKIGGFA